MSEINSHALFCLLYKHTNNDVFEDSPKISEHFPKITENPPKAVRRPDNRFRAISENCVRVPKIAEDFRGRTFKGLCSHSNVDLITSKNNMLFSLVKISCLRVNAHLVFHWCLHNKDIYFCQEFSVGPRYVQRIPSFF